MLRVGSSFLLGTQVGFMSGCEAVAISANGEHMLNGTVSQKEADKSVVGTMGRLTLKRPNKFWDWI